MGKQWEKKLHWWNKVTSRRGTKDHEEVCQRKLQKKKKKKKSGLGSVLYRFHKFSNVAPSFRGTWSRLDEAGAKQEAHNQFRAREEEEEEQRSLPRLYSRPKNSFTAEEDRDRWMRGSWPVSIEGCNTRRVYVHTIHAHTDTYIYIYIYIYM